jgi:hypothetical protein
MLIVPRMTISLGLIGDRGDIDLVGDKNLSHQQHLLALFMYLDVQLAAHGFLKLLLQPA